MIEEFQHFLAFHLYYTMTTLLLVSLQRTDMGVAALDLHRTPLGHIYLVQPA